ncbi:chondroitin sulfate proteoglycan 4, partial [Hyalella azteca]|uniref:Chondroitin sulfate proteoglycan 4 n=1 Tax=Hyalella azteca TaxID=294128 RepID=A0A8B7NQD5_HYAAZ
SFFGASHVWLPLQEARSSTHVHLRLYTSQPDSLILLAAGETDYLLLTLAAGRLSYEHSGSESPRDDFIIVRVLGLSSSSKPSRHDEATLPESPFLRHDETSSLDDSWLIVRRSSPLHVTVIVKNENDEAPVVTINKGINMWQEDTVVVTSDVLEVTDADSPSTEVRFECSEPNNGFLALTHAPNKPVTLFTQHDVESRRLLFKQSGPLVGGFSWRATDGKYRTAAHVFPVTAKAINISVTMTQHFSIFPLTTHIIRDQHLLASFNKPDYNQSVFIIIKRQPKAGRVVMKKSNGLYEHAGTFTQREISSGLVAYEHLRTPSSLHDQDDFIFDIESPPLRILKKFIFNISISISNTEQMQDILGLKPVNVVEGQAVKISQDNLNLSALDRYFSRNIIDDWNPSLITHVSRAPRHGTLTLSGRNLLIGSSLESKDISSGSLVYQHDHSETRSDSVLIEIHIRDPEDSRPMLICNTSLDIIVSPVNDNLFSLEKAKTSIVRFDTKVLTEKDLYTSDLDSSPKDITYQIMSGPANGKLIIGTNSSAGFTFTQSDVAAGLVSYTHDGSNSSTDKFYFQVSDGGHMPKYSAFMIDVEPLKLELINHTMIRIMQAATVSRIANFNLAVRLNTAGLHVNFNVTKFPRHGKLFISGQMVSSFTQEDVDRGDLIYLQSDMRWSRDAFSVLIWCHDVVLPELDMLIEVQPMLKSRLMQAVSGSRVPISEIHLNATELLLVSDSVPVFQVREQPRLSLLKKETVDSDGNLRSFQVQEFSLNDIEASVIFLVVQRLAVEADRPLNDKISFTLSVTGADVQPAKCVLEIVIYPADSNLLNMVNNPRQLRPGNISPDTSTKGNPYDTFEEDTKSLLIVAIVLSVSLALIIIISVSVYCARFRRSAKTEDHKEFDAISLPPPLTGDSRPESFLTDYMSEFATFSDANSPNTFIGERQLECHTSQSDTSLPSDITRGVPGVRDLSPSLPQCKVTPIFTDPSHIGGRSPSNVSQIYQTNARVESPNDWGAYDQNKSVYSPMLRKNQYWV